MTIYLVRHAESEANAGGISRPDHLLELSPKGKQQAETLITRLPRPSQVITSALKRTQQTAEPFCHHWHIIPTINTVLNEFSYLDFSLIQGMNKPQRQQLVNQFWQRNQADYRTGSQVDSFADFNQRLNDFLKLAPTLSDHSICFTHGIWLALLVWKIQQKETQSLSRMDLFRQWQLDFEIENTAIFKLEIMNGEMRIEKV